MLTITHTHLLSMAVIFVVTGLGVALCARVSDRWKQWLVVEPFVALLVSFSAMWLMRYVDARFSWLLEASSSILALTFYVQSLLILRELGARRGDAP
jgi:membrane protein YdbS with pleckstrin-like domain